MTTFRTFEDIDAWRLGRALTCDVYELTRRTETQRDYAFCNQVRRASISITSNIAEGFERNGNREFIQFLSLAKASAGEVRSLLYVAVDQKYLLPDQFEQMRAQCVAVSGKIQSLIDYLRKSELEGSKFR